MVPFDGDVTITCAPAGTTPLEGAPTTPAPSADDDLPSPTRAPVPGDDDAPTERVVPSGEESEPDSNTGVIAGSVAGGAVALLAIAGVVAYKLKKSPPPPPSYDDLVGSA